MQSFSLLQNVHHHTNSQQVQHRPRNARGKPWARNKCIYTYSEELRQPTCCGFYRYLQFMPPAVQSFSLLQSVHHHTNSQDIPTETVPSCGTDLSRHENVSALSAQVPEYCHGRASGLAPVCIPERQISRQCHHVRPSPHLEHLDRPGAYARSWWCYCGRRLHWERGWDGI